MNFTTITRKDDYISFDDVFSKMWDKKIRTKNNLYYKYDEPLQMFKLTELSEGVEGKVFKAIFKHTRAFKKKIVIKIMDLNAIRNSKEISKIELKASPEEMHELFASMQAFDKSSLIEVLSQSLLNELVLQKICPNYTFNYYWEYNKDKILSTYNEFANSNDFHSWAKKKRSNKLWFNALFQIMIGLIAIKRNFGMLHTDFHTQNILVHKVQPGGYWEYTLNNKKYYIPNLGYVFLLHDFGFAWIPNKMYMKWHYNDTLSFLNKNGEEFFDIATFLNIILKSSSLNVPTYFKAVIQNLFSNDELYHLFTKQYYVNHYTKLLKTAKSSNIKLKYKNKIKNYPDLDKNYKGSGKTLEDKLVEIFYEDGYKKTSARSHFLYSDKDYHTNNSFLIESYSLDKKFDKSNLKPNLQTLVIN